LCSLPINIIIILKIEKKASPRSRLNRAGRFLFPMVTALSSRTCKVCRMSILRRNFTMKMGMCVLCLIAVFTVAGCGDSAIKRTSTVRSDADTSWNMTGFGRERTIKFNSLGYLTLGANGEVTGGVAHEFGVDKKKFTGGKILVSDRGSLSGFIDTYLADTDSYDQYIISGGQMTSEKDVALFEGRFPTARRGIVVLILQNKTFAQADLTGTWALLHDGIYHMTIDREGTINGCSPASEVHAGDRACEGKFSVDPAGSVSAGLLFPGAKRISATVTGQVNSGRYLMVLAGSDSTHFEGTTLIFIRRGGTFSIADMEGLWRFSMTGNSGTLFGTIRLDGNGNVIEGLWSRIGDIADDSGEIIGGKLFLTDKGDISGFFKTSGGETREIAGGQMSQKKDIAGALYLDGPGTQGLMLLVRIP
jgi:hypothetical protein